MKGFIIGVSAVVGLMVGIYLLSAYIYCSSFLNTCLIIGK